MPVDRTRKRIVTSLYNAKMRCVNPSDKDYPAYGGRGIKICAEWLDSTDSFVKWALENGYSEKLTLDRIDPNGNYEPSNCRWITHQEQQWNKCNTIYINYRGETKSLGEWSEITGIGTGILYFRVKKNWSEEKLFRPVNKHKKKRKSK